MTIDNERVLVVNGQSSAKNNGTGYTLRSVISLIEQDNVLELFVDDGLSCEVEYDRNMICCDDCFLLAKASHDLFAGKVNNSLKSSAATSETSAGMVSKLKTAVRRAGIYSLDCFPMKISERVLRIVQDFCPTVIYTMAGSVRAMKLAIALSNIQSAPIVVHYMDDWPHESFVGRSLVASLYWNRLRKANRLLLRRARHILAISPLMALEYSQEYGVPATFVGCPIDKTFFSLGKNEKICGIRAVYAGGMHLGRWKSLSAISSLLERFEKETGVSVEFNVYAPKHDISKYSASFSSITHLHEAVPHDQVPAILASHNLLIHAESLEKSNNSAYARLSVSTKIAEYLASGIKFLYFGPSDSALSQMLASNGLAYVAHSNTAVMEALLQIQKDIEGNNSAKQANAVEYASGHYSLEASEATLASVFSGKGD